jgi:hypothetical protein
MVLTPPSSILDHQVMGMHPIPALYILLGLPYDLPVLEDVLAAGEIA